MRLITLFLLISSFVCAQVYRWDVKLAIDTAGQRIYKKKYKPDAETIQNLNSKTNNRTLNKSFRLKILYLSFLYGKR